MGHPSTPLLQECASHVFPVEVGPKWYLPTIRKAIFKGSHTSTLTPTVAAFFRTDILDRYLWGFIIVLTKEDLICLFGTLLCISCLALVDQ